MWVCDPAKLKFFSPLDAKQPGGNTDLVVRVKCAHPSIDEVLRADRLTVAPAYIVPQVKDISLTAIQNLPAVSYIWFNIKIGAEFYQPTEEQI